MPSLVNLSLEAKISPNSILASLVQIVRTKRIPDTALVDLLRIDDETPCMLFMERQQVDFRPSFVFHHIGSVLVGRHEGKRMRDNALVHKLRLC